MAVTNITATSFKSELLSGTHVFGTDVIKILLIKVSPTGTYTAANTNVGTPGTGTPSASNVGTDEVVGTGYTSGGNTLAGFAQTTSGTTAIIDFSNSVWSASTISATKAIIYNSTKSNRIIQIIDFGGTFSDSGSTFTITMPASGATTSIIQVA